MQMTSLPLRRFALVIALGGLLSGLAPLTSVAQEASQAAAWSALKGGAVVLFRHAEAPGVGDPAGFKIGDCSTQRNLDADGQAQALRIGRTFEREGVLVGMVWSSAWCRAKETAELAFPGRLRVEPAFNSFFAAPGLEPTQTATARELLLSWRGPGALVVVTHQVNITALTGADPASGEGLVLSVADGKLVEVGRIAP
ncbi:MAG: histidine phosphatase family protein [Burkholderiales bacterium]